MAGRAPLARRRPRRACAARLTGTDLPEADRAYFPAETQAGVSGT